MKKIMFIAAIVIMASVVISCNSSKSETSKMKETPVDGTEFVICQTTDGAYGVMQGDKMLIEPEYQGMAFLNGMFVADRHLELYGVVSDDKILIEPLSGNQKLTGKTIEYVDGNFVSETDGKKGIYVVKSGHAFAKLDDYALSEEDNLIVTEMEGMLSVLTLKRDTLIEATKDYSKMVILKGKKQVLTFTNGAWFVIDISKGDLTGSPVLATELKKFKNKDGWSDTRKVFSL